MVDDHPIDHAVLTEGDAVRQLQGCACWVAAAVGVNASEPDDRDEFFAGLASLDAEQRGKVLWNLY